jgi:4-hydroxybenzoate polyprenyltransferase
MKLLNLLLIFFCLIPSSNSFLIGKPKTRSQIMKLNHNNNISENNTFGLMQKGRALFKLIRPSNILPTTFLTFTGGWIMKPNLVELLHTPAFIVGIIDTVLIMSTSMVINDLFDIPLDKINNPGRPLITGEVKPIEAIGLSAGLLGISEYLNFMYLPQNLQIVIHSAIATVLLYTPVFKKVTLLKNLSCAGLIAFSTFFAGLTVSPNILADLTSFRDYSSFFFNKNLGLLAINTQLIFFGSLYIEVLLDICDVNGDKKNGINTLPVIYGNELAFKIANRIAYSNILLNFMQLTVLYNFKAGALLMLLYSPMLYYLKEIRKNGLTKENIIKNANKTTLPLFVTLLYFCILSFF